MATLRDIQSWISIRKSILAQLDDLRKETQVLIDSSHTSRTEKIRLQNIKRELYEIDKQFTKETEDLIEASDTKP